MGEGMGTFIRITKTIPLKTSYIISFVDSHMMIQIEGSQLIVRLIEGPKLDLKW